MSTSEPGPFTERGDEAESAAYRGGGVYSGGDFAGGDSPHGDPERYARLSGSDSPGAAANATDSGAEATDVDRNGAGDAPGGAGPAGDVASRDPQHESVEDSSMQDTAAQIGDSPERS